MGADDSDNPNDDEAAEDSGWFARRRERTRQRNADRRAQKEAETAARRDEQHRAELDRQRSLSETKPPAERMRRAITQVRREGYKVAVIYAAVDAALAMLVVNLLLQVLKPASIPSTLPWPRVVFDAIVGATGAPPGPLQTAVVAGFVGGVVVFAVELAVRTRRPFVEQFEGANPEVQEALRTARDAVRSGTDSRMAVALYEDVLARLRRTSSIGLVNLKRVFLTVLVVSVVSIASIQVAVVDLDIGDLRSDGTENPDDRDSEYEGLQDASDVLGEPEDVVAGEETLNTTLSTEGGGDSGGNGSSAAAYESSGFSDTADVDGQAAGFAEREQLEDAELIREYNLRIRDDGEDRDT